MVNEIRKDYLLDRWVIISSKRVKRPHKRIRPKKTGEKGVDNCPFCPGNEDMTPPTIIQKPLKGKWKIRVFENKYPALSMNIEFEEKVEKLKNRITGYGRHLMMVDTPNHNLNPGLYNQEQWRLWFHTIKDIFYQSVADENIEYVLVFKNHGIEAGASQPHPHTQIITLPTVPFLISEEMKKAREYYSFEGKCLFCNVIKLESREKLRIVLENNHVIAFCPYAPLWPYEVWIFPKKHTPSIQMNEKLENEVLNALRVVLKTYHYALDNPPFNFYLHTAYMRMKDHVPQAYHFHIEIAPRLEKDAGFELGAGMNITTVAPEDAAEFLRETLRK